MVTVTRAQDGEMLGKKREKTSVSVNPELWKKARIAAVQREKEISDAVEEGLILWLRQLETGGVPPSDCPPISDGEGDDPEETLTQYVLRVFDSDIANLNQFELKFREFAHELFSLVRERRQRAKRSGHPTVNNDTPVDG